MVVSSDGHDVVPKEVIEKIEVAINGRLDWLIGLADGDKGIVSEINKLRRNISDVLAVKDQQVTALMRGLKEAVNQRDGYLYELIQIEQDVADLDGAKHPLIAPFGQQMRDMAGKRAHELAEIMFNEKYEEIMEDSVEYAEESVWEHIADEIGNQIGEGASEGYDVLHLLTGVGRNVMTPEHVAEFHAWVQSVARWNKDERERRRNGGK